MGYRTTQSNPCIYTRQGNVIILYVNDYIILAPTKDKGDKAFLELKQKGFDMTDEGTLEEYVPTTMKTLAMKSTALMMRTLKMLISQPS